MYGWNKKHALLLGGIIFGCLIIIVLIFSWKTFSKNHNGELGDNKAQDNKGELVIEKDDSIIIEVENDDIVLGSEVLEKYAEVKGEKCAILVATTLFLEKDKIDLIEYEEYPFIRYVLSKGENRIVENVNSSTGQPVPLAFVNYNAVLDDTCLFQSFTGVTYETNYGFVADNNKEVENSYFLLTQSEKEDMCTIREDASFLSKIIYNNDGDILGYAYIEQ